MKHKLELLQEELTIICKGTKLIKEYLGKGYLFLKIILSSLRVLTPYVSIYMSGKIITALTENVDFETIIKYVFFTVSSIFLLDVISRVVNRKCLIMLNSCWYKHEALLSRKALSLDYGKAESASVTALRAQISENARSNGAGVIWLAEAIATIVSDVISLIIAIIILSGMFICHSNTEQQGLLALANSPILAFILALFTVLLIIVTVKANNQNAKLVFEANNYGSSAIPILEYYTEKVLNENESGKDIRIFNEKNIILDELKHLVISPFQKAKELIFKTETTYGMVSVAVTTILGGLVYIFVGLKALAGAFGAGKVVEYYGTITKLILSISSIASKIGYLKSNNLYLKQELEFLNLESDLKNGKMTLETLDTNNIEFEFHNISFKYPDTDIYVLKDLSFKITSGEKLAVVGINGSGKTSMIKLLCRLYDPNEGKITVNGIDIREFDLVEYLKLFAIVFQDFKLLAFPIGENIAGSENYDEEKVWKCLKMAGIKERIEEFPKGLKQAIYKLYEKDGIDISGGEEQKIAIARALYKDAPFVILDEPTAALDPISENEIYSKFNEIIKDKTTIYISHRLSSCRFCDRIVVFENGSIIQEGTHNELVSNVNGRYYQLWNSQAKYYSNN